MSITVTKPEINLREIAAKADSIPNPKEPYLYFTGTTTDATATDIGKIVVEEGETVGIVVHTISTEYDVSGERGYHIRQALFYRDAGGNVTLQGSVSTVGTDIEVTAGQDVTLEADTTAQTIDIKVTGIAASNMEWRSKVELVRITEHEYHVHS